MENEDVNSNCVSKVNILFFADTIYFTLPLFATYSPQILDNGYIFFAQ